MTDRVARNARAEAEAIAGAEARVLEPSPPAVDFEPWFADDPTDVGGAGPDVLSPTSAGARSWQGAAAGDERVAAYAREHWLANYKTLAPVPDGYVSTRDDLHRIAYGVVSNARKAANGKFGLRYTHRGFGTPFFGADEQVRVEVDELVIQRGESVVSETLTTLARAAELAGTVANSDQAEHDTIDLGSVDRPLDIDPVAASFLGDWFGFGTSVLEETRLIGVAADDDVSRVQIWPGHFDPAMEIGSLDAGRRATYGASPGDASHDEPYLYVASWGEIDQADPYWNDEGFNGASLGYADLLAAADPRKAALEFFRKGYDVLHG